MKTLLLLQPPIVTRFPAVVSLLKAAVVAAAMRGVIPRGLASLIVGCKPLRGA